MSNLNNIGAELSNRNELDRAIATLLKALEFNPKDANLNFNLALVYIKKKKFKRAIGLLEASVAEDPNDDNLREIGNCYIRLNNLEKAKEYLFRSVDEFGSSKSENSLGVLFFLGQNYKEALIHFEVAAKLNPKDPDIWYNLTDTYKELNMNKESEMAKDKFRQLG